MTAHEMAGAHPAGHAEEHAEGHDPISVGRFGLLLFIFSESFLFAAFIASRLYLAGLDKPEHLNMVLGVAMTAILIGSSLLSYRGLTAFGRGDTATAARWLLGTVLLGLLFVVGVGIEWATAEFSITSSYGSSFYTITGLHVTHLLFGVGAMALGVRLLRRGHFAGGSGWGVRGLVLYWTYVDLMWVLVIFPTLYLL
jgi:heme/copper-type cytochrome/quinol oxidase subunit 3